MFRREAFFEKLIDSTQAAFVSEALEMLNTPPYPKKPRVQICSEACGPMVRMRPRRLQSVDHLLSSATILCSDARFMTVKIETTFSRGTFSYAYCSLDSPRCCQKSRSVPFPQSPRQRGQWVEVSAPPHFLDSSQGLIRGPSVTDNPPW